MLFEVSIIPLEAGAQISDEVAESAGQLSTGTAHPNILS